MGIIQKDQRLQQRQDVPLQLAAPARIVPFLVRVTAVLAPRPAWAPGLCHPAQTLVCPLYRAV